jgi:putative glutamine amidotransferase
VSPPRILITTRHDERRGKAIQFVGGFHLDLVIESGGAPVPVLALDRMRDHLPALLEDAGGLLITEGGDLGPELRGPEPEASADLFEVDPVKDTLEAELVRRALAMGMPILGICRGCELVNVVMGGDLYLDLPRELGSAVPHLDTDRYHENRHPISIAPGSPLSDIYGDGELMVTSYHHQGVRRLADGLEVMARSPDGLVESFRSAEHPFVWGLQFHPERQLQESEAHHIVHRRFVEAARQFAGRPQ